MQKIPLYGMAFLKNGVKFDYPFRESLQCLTQLCHQSYLALGDCDDDTADQVADITKLNIIPTCWEDSRTDGGHIFSEQTNIALTAIRKHHHEPQAWALYLQCDEIFHEAEWQQVQVDIARAEASGCDAVSFRYIHFWQSHNAMAINKKWYPQEIRAIKVDSPIVSTGDAQGFGGHQKIYDSDCHIYHYGHVREEKAYAAKMGRMIKYYYPTEKLQKYIRRWKRKDQITETLPFYLQHPQLMKNRIERLGGVFTAPPQDEIFIVGKKDQISRQFLKTIHCKKINFISSPYKLSSKQRKHMIILTPNWWQKILFPTRVPQKMHSKFARNWTTEFHLALKLAEIGVGTSLPKLDT